MVSAVRTLGVAPESFPALAQAMEQSRLMGGPQSMALAQLHGGGGGSSDADVASGVGACVDGLAAMLSSVSLSMQGQVRLQIKHTGASTRTGREPELQT